MLISGSRIASDLCANLKQTIETHNLSPKLSVILVGSLDASKMYVEMKQKKAIDIGIICDIHRFPDTITENTILETIDNLNKDTSVHGIMVQLPLPKHFNEFAILNLIDIHKDVDGLHSHSVASRGTFKSCTPMACIELIKTIQPNLKGLIASVVGSCGVVGSQTAQLLAKEGCTVIMIDRFSHNPQLFTQSSDILVVACGKPKLITSNWVSKKTIVIDVGINKVDGKVCGDVDFDSVKDNVRAITPVPGGVGPMTIAMLMQNTVNACKTNSV